MSTTSSRFGSQEHPHSKNYSTILQQIHHAIPPKLPTSTLSRDLPPLSWSPVACEGPLGPRQQHFRNSVNVQILLGPSAGCQTERVKLQQQPTQRGCTLNRIGNHDALPICLKRVSDFDIPQCSFVQIMPEATGTLDPTRLDSIATIIDAIDASSMGWLRTRIVRGRWD